jgi:hypothetical protein
VQQGEGQSVKLFSRSLDVSCLDPPLPPSNALFCNTSSLCRVRVGVEHGAMSTTLSGY